MSGVDVEEIDICMSSKYFSLCPYDSDDCPIDIHKIEVCDENQNRKE